MHAPQRCTATEKLTSFENRYTGRHADQFAFDSGVDAQDVHKARFLHEYGKRRDNTKKTFDGVCGRWIGFCEERGFDMLDTSAKIGREFLEGERVRHANPGKNVEIALSQFKKLFRIRGCPEFSKDGEKYMQAVSARPGWTALKLQGLVL